MVSRIKMSNPKGLPTPAGTYSHVARVRAGEEMRLEIAAIAALD